MNKTNDNNTLKHKGAYFTGTYRNLFTELLGKKQSDVEMRINKIWEQLFYGNNKTERIYYPVEPDMAYIKDTCHNDVRSEGISYGMMISVQFNKKEEFDRLWKWTKKYMQHRDKKRENYFAWHLRTDGTIISPNSAPDGEEWIVMALFFAAGRWGSGKDIYNYEAEAQTILNSMLDKAETSEDDTTISNIFNIKKKQIVFVPLGASDDFTDPSYHTPHFYELWGYWADENKNFWRDVASTSRDFLQKAAHPVTGLTPDYANFDGTPIDPWQKGNNNFQYDAWRVAMNIGLDYEWFSKDTRQIKQINKLLDFFEKKGIKTHGSKFTLNGKTLSTTHNPGLLAMNAAACLASTNENRKVFLRELWNTDIPIEEGRYFDGLLYMLGMLAASGNFRIYAPKR